MAIKTILVSQPKPEGEKSPYYDLAEKYGLTIDFRPFIHVQGATAQEVRTQKINFADFSAVIMTSKVAVDHYFRLAEEMRFQIPDEMKYFCVSEAIALYLQKYVTYRKRKIFFGSQNIESLAELMKKHKAEKFLLPCTDILRDKIPGVLESYNYNFTKAVLYKTVASDLSDLENVYYDVLAFFSPAGIESLFKNFPDFKQNNTIIAVFGPTTALAAEKNDLRVDILAPHPNYPSMTAAIEGFIKEDAKKSKPKK